MDYNALLDLSVALGHRLQRSGAETYRVEEAVSRLLTAYGVNGEVYSIPNCIIISLETEDRQPLTRMCRVSGHGTDLDRVELYNGLSRKLCAETPPLEAAFALVREADRRGRDYTLPLYLLGCFIASAGFAMFFQGSLIDALAAGISGIFAGLCLHGMDTLHTNEFFKTILAAFVSSGAGSILAWLGLVRNVDAVIIGPLTMLVPGFLFTNSMRDIIYGDTMSGVNRLVQVVILSVAIAIGSGFALAMVRVLHSGFSPSAVPISYTPAAQCVIAFGACIGFCVIFNIHGPGMVLCALGSMLGWMVFLIVTHFGLSDNSGYLLAAVFISAYAETMARVRKYPATSYLVISLFPLFPGAYLYYALSSIMLGDIGQFSSKALYAAGASGSLAVGVLLVSTIVRMWTVWKRKQGEKPHTVSP